MYLASTDEHLLVYSNKLLLRVLNDAFVDTLEQKVVDVNTDSALHTVHGLVKNVDVNKFLGLSGGFKGLAQVVVPHLRLPKNTAVEMFFDTALL